MIYEEWRFKQSKYKFNWNNWNIEEFNLENLIKVDNIKFYKDLQTAHFFI